MVQHTCQLNPTRVEFIHEEGRFQFTKEQLEETRHDMRIWLREECLLHLTYANGEQSNEFNTVE
jgi:hypothetical protein